MQDSTPNYRVLLVHDAEIDDICALVNYPRVDLELICSDINKFTEAALEAKSRLYQAMTRRDLASIPAIMTNGAGVHLHEEELTQCRKLISAFFGQFRDFKIFIIFTGQCAPVFGILYSLLHAGTISPKSFEIIWINGRHNGLGCGAYLKDLARFEPVLWEFNAYSSMGEGLPEFLKSGVTPVKYLSTGVDFGHSIPTESIMADYARKFNYSLLKGTPSHIRKLALAQPKLAEIANMIEVLLNKGDDLGLKPKRCKKLAELFSIVLERTPKDNIVTLSYLGPKLAMLQSNLVQFPLHDLAAVLMLQQITTGNTLLEFQNAYAWSNERFIEISPVESRVSTGFLLPLQHAITRNPEEVRKYLEKMVFDF